MIRIQTPASTSNLGVGFDSLGMALNIYNTFLFEPAIEFELFGFEEANQTDNLVQKAYIACSEYFNAKYIRPVKITLETNEIPVSRGLGSSASCIVAGALAANKINHLGKSKRELAEFASEFEGHPDNAFATLYGGLISVLKKESGYDHNRFSVSKTLRFGLLIPEQKGNTQMLRKILPKKINLEDAVFNLSRMIHVPKAFRSGNISMLKEVLQDKVHEDYRKQTITDYAKIKTICKEHGLIALISGSGPTVFLLGKEMNEGLFSDLLDTYRFKHVEIAAGAKSEVVL